MVFLSDKERNRYRFFVEHNVPPRCVWLTRHSLWLATVVTIGIVLVTIGDFWRFIGHAGPKPELLLAIATAYAAGQWTSMLVGSSVLAGFFGLLLTAALSGWIYLMHAVGIDLTWSVLPIPLALMCATWLRARLDQ